MPRERLLPGEIMDAHDGNTVQFTPGGLYYWCTIGTAPSLVLPPPPIFKAVPHHLAVLLRYAMGYGKCIENGKQADQKHGCGLRANNTVGVCPLPAHCLSLTFHCLITAFFAAVP